MEVVAKAPDNKVKLHDNTIHYLKIFGETAESIEGICRVNNDRDADREFRNISRRLTKYYTQNKINEKAFEHLLSILIENYFFCKTEKLINRRLSKLF